MPTETLINVGKISHSMKEAVQQQFFYYPMTQFGVRELARRTNLDTKTVLKYLKDLVRRKVVLKKKEEGTYPHYEANRLSLLYRHEKSEVLVKKILESGVVEWLNQSLKPKAIVLFGSVQKGTYHESSDVDLFVQADYKKLDLERFNIKIGHPIQLFFEKDLKNLSRGMLENIYNGLVLGGRLEPLA